jgi:peptidoglycan/xylan/chitin deacetylase (PgdA/CDA1 family)
MTVRIDRLATLYVVDPLRRCSFNSQAAIPILMYHSVADEDEAGVHPYYRTATAASVFAAQMETLHQNGFSVISPMEAINACREHEAAKNSVVITFDDGFHNFYLNAFPVLKRYGFTATMYLPTAYIGESRLSFKGKECLTWAEVRELQKHGILFGSHTVTHPQLHDCDASTIKREIADSKQTIEQKLGCAVQSFAYPYAFPEADASFKQRLREDLRDAGYENGVCTTVGRSGTASDPFFLKRLPVNSDDDSRLFRAKLAGSYDWLAKPQYLVKKVKKWVGAGSTHS